MELILIGIVWVLMGIIMSHQSVSSLGRVTQLEDLEDVVSVIIIIVFAPVVMAWRMIYGIFRKHNV